MPQEKSPIYFPILKVTINLQIALISKRIELLERDWTQMKDFLKLFPDLTNFPYLFFYQSEVIHVSW